ncbi:hypothetical protein AURDEDRAFT_113306 [Auricularia subglabra TFB-10046 SS5]|nr:hypothetical protein AURDEDRAFT_113306 [Auricularia subglabra TFB-10046 SS5]
MSLAAAARSPLTSPALKHALNGGACYFSMASASHLGMATSPGAARSPLHLHQADASHLGSPHFSPAVRSPGQMHLALPVGPPMGFTLRLPQHGGGESPSTSEGFTLRLPAEKRMPPRALGATPAMSPMSPRTLGATSAALPPAGDVSFTLRTPDAGTAFALRLPHSQPAKEFTMTLPAPRRKVNVNIDALEDATPAPGAVAVKTGRKGAKATAQAEASGGGGGFVGLVRRTVRFVLPSPAPEKGASEFRSCRGRPPTPYPKKGKGGKSDEAPDYFSAQD